MRAARPRPHRPPKVADPTATSPGRRPEITAKYVSLSPLVVLLATALGGVPAGLVGLIVAVPFAAVAVKAVRLARRSVDAPAAPAATAHDP